MTKPPAVFPGDTVAVCAPAGAVDRESVERGAEELRALGFNVRLSERVFERHLFTAGTADDRLAELHGLFADDQVRALVCARGGSGIGRLLSRLDPELVRRRPKLVVGYSDVTALHLWLATLGIASAHGPLVAHELSRGAYDKERFLATLAGGPWPDVDGLDVLRRGEASGRLRGGCLSLLAAQAGTPWALRGDPEGTILFVEDVDERPYRIDRMLQQLRDAGAFERVTGIVFGQMRGCQAGEISSFTLQDVVREALDFFEGPVAWGLVSGHVDGPFVTLPLGVRARLACGGDQGVLAVEEAAVS
jgi:muramoyltetrapeptide carboxypeptidase